MISEALQCSLEELGISAKIVSDEEGGKADIVFIPWSASTNLDKFDYTYSIHITSEQLPYFEDAPEHTKKMWREKVPELSKYDFLFEHSSQQVEFLRAKGYNNVIHFPWGYTPVLDRWQHTDTLPYDRIDISFIGGVTPRRKKIIQNVGKVHWHTKINKENESDIVTCSRVNLNIKNNNRGCFEAGRVICLLLGNRGFTISEPYEDDVPLVDREHLVVAKAEDFSDTVKYYLTHPEERVKIAKQGYEFVKNYYTMTQNLKEALTNAQIPI